MSKFVLEKLSFKEQDGKEIADFLVNHFHADHSLDGGDSPKVHWGKTSWQINNCLLYTSPSPRDKRQYRMPSSA